MASSEGDRSAARDANALAFAIRHFGGSVRAATHTDLPSMAHIHAASGTPGLLTDLGEGFLRDVFYARLLQSPYGHALAIELEGEVAGFVTFSPNSARLFSDIFGRSLSATGVAIVRASVHKPRVIRDFAETVMSVRGEAPGASIDAESVTLEVAPKYQGLGLGLVLLQAGVEALRDMGVNRIKARLLVDNVSVERLYPPLGFVRGPEFRLHGRVWVLWTLDDAH